MKSKTSRKVFICPKCGVPNIVGDRKCMYCDTKFTGIRAFFSFFVQKFKKKSGSPPFTGKRRVPVGWATRKTAGALLLLAGLFLFVTALIEGSFKNWIIGVILLVYGGVLLKK